MPIVLANTQCPNFEAIKESFNTHGFFWGVAFSFWSSYCAGSSISFVVVARLINLFVLLTSRAGVNWR